MWTKQSGTPDIESEYELKLVVTYTLVVLQYNPANSNSQGKRKIVRVSGGSS